MARPRKTARYDAPAEVIKRYFEESWQAREEQKSASSIIAETNSRMEEEGVHPGVLSVMRRIRAMPAGKRGFFLFLLQRYAAVLEEELHDPTFKEPGAEVHPFGGARTASAA